VINSNLGLNFHRFRYMTTYS